MLVITFQFLLDNDKLFFCLQLKKNRYIDKYMINLKFHSNISLLMFIPIQIWRICLPLLNYIDCLIHFIYHLMFHFLQRRLLQQNLE